MPGDVIYDNSDTEEDATYGAMDTARAGAANATKYSKPSSRSQRHPLYANRPLPSPPKAGDQGTHLRGWWQWSNNIDTCNIDTCN